MSILRGEEAWAEAQFARSHWNDVDPECEECGGAINDGGDCMLCGKPYMSNAERSQCNAEDRAEYLDQCRRDGE